ncbi:MAG: peptidase [Myxococcales bacterium]|nr:peptidase [Myxococcales bacterium]
MPISTEAAAVHDAATPIDLHADTPKLMSRGYDLALRHATAWPLSSYGGHIDLPRMREGNLAAQFFGMWTFPLPERGCARDIHRQLDALERTAAAVPDQLALATSADEVRGALAQKKRVGLRGIEGAHALEGDLENLEAFARRGVRYLGLLHFSSSGVGFPAKGWGRDDAKGLTSFGCEVVDASARLGVIVDLAHVNRKGFFDAVARKPGPLIVSHTGVLGAHAHWRNIDDEQIRAVADSGGVVGIIFAPRFLGGHLEAVVDHLLHVVKVAGDGAVALGSDWDGFVKPCDGLADAAQLPNLTEALLRRNMTPEAIHKLLGGNVLRVLEMAPPRVAVDPPRSSAQA